MAMGMMRGREKEFKELERKYQMVLEGKQKDLKFLKTQIKIIKHTYCHTVKISGINKIAT